jgi:hypothetical protein
MCIRNAYVSVTVNVPAVTSGYCGTREYARFITVREISKVTRNKRRQRHTCQNIPIYIQEDATLHSLFYLETALHVSGGS